MPEYMYFFRNVRCPAIRPVAPIVHWSTMRSVAVGNAVLLNVE